MYYRSGRPRGDNNGTSIDLVPGRRGNGPGSGFGGIVEDLVAFAQNPNPQFFSDSQKLTSGDFKQVTPTVCKPTNTAALRVVQFFQQQMNRVAQAKGFTKIADDGDVGPGTLSLFRQVQGASGGKVMGDGSSCVGIFPDLSAIGGQIKALADSLGVPATVSGPAPIKPPSIVDPKTNIEIPVPPKGGFSEILSQMSTPMKVGFAGILGGIGYFLLVPPKKKGKR